MEPLEPGLRARKKQRVRDSLVDVALELFLANGYDATTIDDIADASDLSRRTFFRYFQTKEDVVLAWVDGFCDRVLPALRERPAREDPLVSLQHAYIAATAHYEADRAHFLAIERLIATTPAIRAAKRELLERLVADVTIEVAARLRADHRRDLRPRVIASAASAVVTAAVDVWLVRGGKVPLSKVMEQAFACIASA